MKTDIYERYRIGIYLRIYISLLPFVQILNERDTEDAKRIERARGRSGRTKWRDNLAQKITAKNASVSCPHEMWARRAFSKGFFDRGRKLVVRDLYRRG